MTRYGFSREICRLTLARTSGLLRSQLLPSRPGLRSKVLPVWRNRPHLPCISLVTLGGEYSSMPRFFASSGSTPCTRNTSSILRASFVFSLVQSKSLTLGESANIDIIDSWSSAGLASTSIPSPPASVPFPPASPPASIPSPPAVPSSANVVGGLGAWGTWT